MAESTRSTYNVGLRRFRDFCTRHDVSHMPASRDTIIYFAVSLSKTLSPATIQVYIAAVGTAHRERGLQDPTADNHRLKLVLRGIRRQHIPTTSRLRHAITPRILTKMLHAIANCKKLSKFDRRMLSAAFTLAFHGFLRVSEFTMPTNHRFNPRFHPTPKHVRLHRHHFSFFIPHSKTDQFHRGHTLNIAEAKPSICPVRHMRAYLKGGDKWQGPLFVFKDGTPLTRKRCLQYLRYSLQRSGYNPLDFNTHSFRIGAATTAAHSGEQLETIQQRGRWKSRAVQNYIRPYPTRRQV